MRRASCLLLLLCVGCSIQYGSKLGGGWKFDWIPPSATIADKENRNMPELKVNFGGPQFDIWPNPMHESPPPKEAEPFISGA